jgi:hypothetical protein
MERNNQGVEILVPGKCNWPQGYTVKRKERSGHLKKSLVEILSTTLMTLDK